MKLKPLGLIIVFTLLTILILTDRPSLFLRTGSVGLAESVIQQKLEADRLLNQGAKQYQISEYQAAIQSLETALKLYQKIEDRHGEALALNNLGNTYLELGKYQKALEFYQQSLTIKRQMDDRNGEGISLNNLGNAYQELGQYEKALEFYQQSLTISREIGDRNGEGTCLINLGEVYRNLGQYEKAIAFYQQSLTIKNKMGDRNGEGISLNNLGNAYNDLGQYQKAIEFYQQSLGIFKEIGDRSGEGNSLGNLGKAYRNLRKYEKAIEFFEQSLKISREIGSRNREGNALGNLGETYRNLEQFEKAIEFYQQSLTLVREIGNRKGEGISIMGLGNTYRDLGEYQKALEFYQQSLKISREIGDRQVEGISLMGLGYSQFKLENISEGEKHLFASLEVLESLRQVIQDDINKISLFETQRDAYTTLQKALIAQNKIHQALEISERGRGRILAELLAQRLAPNSGQFSPIVTLAQLQKIAKQQNATLVEYSRVGDEVSRGEKKEYFKSEVYIWVIKPTGEVGFRSSKLMSFSQQQKSDLSRLIFAARCFNREICKSDFNLAAGGRLTRTQTRSSRSGTRLNETQNSPNSSEHKQEEFKRLYQILIKPIEDLLPKNPNERVIFVPTDSLFYLPFAALQDEAGTVLIEKHTMSFSPSIMVLDSTYQQRQNLSSSASDILIVGNPQMPKLPTNPEEEPVDLEPLPFAEKEANSIAQVLQIQPLIGANATESTVLNRMEKARIIHFATHGIFNNHQPLKSAIALTPSGSKDEEDGLLTAEQIFGLNLKAELVVLSACDTGLGIVTGDGVIGLSRSFLSAGVPSLVVSLWSVDDQATGELMTEFYQNLQTTKDKAQALRQAMLTLKKTKPNPYYWSAFTLMGEAL